MKMLAALAFVGVLAAPRAHAAAPAPAVAAEIRRGLATAGHSASIEPAMRTERSSREPSAGFTLGAALGAWINAAAVLDYDLKTPSGDGDDSAAIAEDCFDERTAFGHLERGRERLSLEPDEVLGAADGSGAVEAWRRRQAGPLPACR
jgi:hypothetical protein